MQTLMRSWNEWKLGQLSEEFVNKSKSFCAWKDSDKQQLGFDAERTGIHFLSPEDCRIGEYFWRRTWQQKREIEWKTKTETTQHTYEWSLALCRLFWLPCVLFEGQKCWPQLRCMPAGLYYLLSTSHIFINNSCLLRLEHTVEMTSVLIIGGFIWNANVGEVLTTFKIGTGRYRVEKRYHWGKTCLFRRIYILTGQKIDFIHRKDVSAILRLNCTMKENIKICKCDHQVFEGRPFRDWCLYLQNNSLTPYWVDWIASHIFQRKLFEITRFWRGVWQ